jgi:hypothetical protein
MILALQIWLAPQLVLGLAMCVDVLVANYWGKGMR